MSIYLHDIPLSEAQARLDSALRKAGMWGVLGEEEIPLDENALGRVLARAVWAKLSSPHYHASAMDGFAIRSEQTSGAMPNAPLILPVRHLPFEGVPANSSVHPGAVYLDTGDPLPLWADSVIPIENVEPIDEQGRTSDNPRYPAAIRIRAAVTPWSHVRPLGEDIVATQLVLPAGHTLRPVDLGAIAASGHDRIDVARKPRVAILPTGSELAPIGHPVQPGKIIEYNSLVLSAQVNDWGGEAVQFPITPDDVRLIRERLSQAARENDLILLNAGSSAGSEDFSARVIEELGQVLAHGVAVRPGHPVILGVIQVEGDESKPQVPVIGVPGYPVSAALTGEIFVQPLLARWTGRQLPDPVQVIAHLSRKVTSPAGDDDYIRVAVGRVGERLVAAPLSRGAGVITSLVRADGIAILPRGVQGLLAGEPVQVRLYRSQAEIERTIFAVGSHDITLDVIAQYLAPHGRRLASANVGSQAGLVALRRGEAHLAGSHLFDPPTREYNLPFIDQYLAGTPVAVVGLVLRQQGLLVAQGNPKAIRSLEDLARPEVRFINRQRGAGTRVMLDYQLDRLGIAAEQVEGYAQEEYTHLAVAAAVSSGRADCGLGIAAAAQALGIEFIPLFQERYDLVIPLIHYESDLLAPLLRVLKEPDFRNTIDDLAGYDTSIMGKVVIR